ncbi:MAG TPA: hypothetical protein VHD83_25350 [Puia sp.]|nr:hypothetical protein [Puia sp.]
MQSHKTPCILLSIVGVLLFIACKKDNHDATPPPVPKIPLIKTVFAMAGSDSDLRTYSYDAQSRVTKIVYSLYGTGRYAYTDTGIVYTFYNLNDSLTSTTVYKQDAHGKAISFLESTSPSDIFTSTFNSDGQLSTSTEVRTLTGQPVRTWATTFHYTNKNLDSSIEVYTYNGTSNASPTYYDDYYTDKISTIGNDNYGQGWLGSGSKNPVKAARDIGTSGGGVYPETTYQYEYDSVGRITKQMHFWGSSQFAPIYFTYY